MEPLHYKFGGGATDTVLHPLVLSSVVILGIFLLLCPRRFAIPAFLFGTFLIPAGQEILLLGVHVFVYRILVLVGLLGLLRIKKEPRLAGGWNVIDSAFFLSIISHVMAFIFLYWELSALINQIGFIWDYLGGYLFLRMAIRNTEDVFKAIKCFAFLAMIYAVCMVGEQITGENIFGLLGGVRLISEVRLGRVRSEAVFQHAILAGTFAGTVLPLFVLLWKNTKSKAMGIVAVFSATVMTITSACSTPLLAYTSGLFGILMWPARRGLRLLRWSLVISLICIALVMKAPVWFLIAHVGVVAGSSVSHRADLVDTFIRHVGDWWLLGTANNGTWGYDMFDTSNQYVEWGVTGGLISLVFFLATISRSFGRLGRARKFVERRDRSSEWLLWLLGSALFANTVAFFGIGYFDQTRVAWFALLAMISAATLPVGLSSRVSAPTPTYCERSSDERALEHVPV